MKISKIERKLKKVLKKTRFEHTRGVSYTAACLAMIYGADIDKARLAGILHGSGKAKKIKRS